jgi:hypothetical protein
MKAAAPVQIGIRTNNGDGSGSGVAVVNVTTSWQQFYVSCVSASTSTMNFGIDTRTFVSGDNGLAKTVICADWQINRGTTPTAYLPTTTAARVGLALDYDPATHAAKGLLVEPAATNLVLASASGKIGSLWIVQGGTATGGQSDPSGGNEAAQVVVTTNTAGNNYFLTIPTVNGTTYTASMWLKGTAGQQIYFSANTLQVGVHNILVTFTGAWQRISSTVTTNVTASYIALETYNRGGGAHLPNVTFQCWGANYEVGTVATSYIPTLAATVTRAADNVTVTPAQINHSATAGSWWADIEVIKPPAAVARIIGYEAGSMTPLYMQANTAPMYVGLFDGAGNILKLNSGSNYGRHKVASAFQINDRALTFDGLAASTDTTAGIAFGSPGALIGIGGDPGTTQGLYIRQTRYLPRRQTNTELQVSTILPGGASMLGGEANGLGIDFTWPINTERVAIATAGILSQSTVNSFMQNAGTSPKTIYDVTGRLGWSPHNLYLQSQTFDNGSWAKSSAAITANAITAPDGTMTADALIPPVGVVGPYINQITTVVSGVVYTTSVYVKYGPLNNPWFLLQVDSVSAYYNLATGVKGSTTGLSNNMVAVGGGWYRCDMTLVASSTSMISYLAMSAGDGIPGASCTNGNGVTPGFYLWGAQLNLGPVPLTYIPTITSTKIGVGEDYDPVTHAGKGVLVEPPATNNIVWSGDFTNVLWVAMGMTVTPNAITAPNGLMEGIKLVESGTVTGMYQDTPSVTGTVSIYAKAGEFTELCLSSFSSGACEGFDLVSGTTFIVTVSGANQPRSGLATMQNCGNGWWRCIAPCTAWGDYAIGPTLAHDLAIPVSTGRGLYVWGPQLEATANRASSYIPTTSATVTRAADAYNFLLSTMPAFSTEFTLYSRWQASDTNSGRFAWCVTDNQGAPNDFAGFFAQIALGRFQIGDQTASQASIAAGALVANTTVAMAGRVKANNFAASMNGAAVVSDTVGTQPTVTHCRFGNTGGSSSASAQFYVEKMAIICRGLTDAELVTKAAT